MVLEDTARVIVKLASIVVSKMGWCVSVDAIRKPIGMVESTRSCRDSIALIQRCYTVHADNVRRYSLSRRAFRGKDAMYIPCIVLNVIYSLS